MLGEEIRGDGGGDGAVMGESVGVGYLSGGEGGYVPGDIGGNDESLVADCEY